MSARTLVWCGAWSLLLACGGSDAPLDAEAAPPQPRDDAGDSPPAEDPEDRDASQPGDGDGDGQAPELDAAAEGGLPPPARECTESPGLTYVYGTPPAGGPTPLDCGSAGTAVVDHGPPENRVNLVLLGDGYTRSELTTTYVDHIQRFVDHMLSPEGEPYPSYERYLNVCRLSVESAESGTDIPDEGVEVDTAFDGNGSDRTRLGLIDDDKVRAALDDLLEGTRVDPDWVAITLNVNRWFNSGGWVMVWSGGHPGGPEVALHEGGHAFHGLADEYGSDSGDTYNGGEPREPNVTADPSAEKWDRWLGYDQPEVGLIDAYEGGRYCEFGIWRPSQNAKMNQVPALHNAPSMEKIVRDIYELVRPVDAWTENSEPLDNPCALELQLVDPERVSVDWSVDGSVVITRGGATLDVTRQLSTPGEHQVSARVYDETPFVRGERDELEQTITWTVRVP